MRKIIKMGALVGGTLLTLVLTALPALAQNYPPQPPGETQIIQGPGAEQVAFTGRDVTLLVVMVGVLLIAGVSALLLARRRAAAAG